MSAYQSGSVTLANAVGTGIADDKAVYSYMPEIVRFFTGEEPILHNVPTYRCREKEALSYVLANLGDLVVRRSTARAATACWWGPHATKREIEEFGRKLAARARRLHRPADARSLDLPDLRRLRRRAPPRRPAALRALGRRRHPDRAGGLTRVALKEGSLVVNSSQGAAPRTPGCSTAERPLRS